MSAPKKNQFWKARSKHGRDKIFATPEDMLEAAYEYFQWNSANPWHRNEAIKSGDSVGKIIKVPTERPLTIEGLCGFWGVNTEYLRRFEKQLIDNDLQDFSRIVKQIRDIIYRQKFEGAAVGAFNSSIIIRDLGLREHTELTGKDGEPLQSTPSIIINQVSSAAEILEREDE